MENVVRTFIDLASIYSPSGEEEKARSYILDRLKGNVDELFVDKAGNIYAYKNGKGKPLLFCAHIDTVRPAQPQKPVIKKGIIHSNGTSVLGADDKTAVAAIITLLDNPGSDNHRPIEVLLTVREETDAGIRSFPRSKIKAKECILSDYGAPIGTIVTGAPYVAGYSIEVTAPGGHVGDTNKNTIHPLTFLTAFRRIVPFGRIRKDTITNIGIVHMGESYNSVPQKLHFTGEIRTFSQKQYDLFLKTIKESVTVLDKKIGTKSMLTLYPYCKGYLLKGTDISKTVKIIKSLGIKTITENVFSVGDFNILNEWGITAVNIGNGALEVHTTCERVAVKDLETLKDIFVAHILS